MGLLTINLPKEVIEELRKHGAYVPDLILRGVLEEIQRFKRINASSARSFNWDILDGE